MVALKMILTGHFASPLEIRRFRSEAQNAARLRHPNIVGIYEVGDFEGQPYFAMELVEGRRLSDYMNGQPLPPRQAAEIIRATAAAVQAGHEGGVVHRDLKPANILIDSCGEPRITDFGLSKRLTSDGADIEALTLSGHAVGSPGYMAPEQVAGRDREVGPTSDVYSLGAVLYYLLTGRPPFQAASVHEVLRQVAETDPVPPRLLVPLRREVRDLETVCLKCLEKEPSRRYGSARELVEELERVLRDEPIQARPAGFGEKMWRWCRRRPAVAGLSLAMSVLVIAVAAGSLWTAIRLERAREAAVRARDRATRTVNELELQTAERFLENGDSASAIALLSKMLRENPANPIAESWLVDVLGRFAYPVALTPAMAPSGVHARFSPDGRVVATGLRSGLRIWEAHSGRLLAETVSFGTVNYIEFSPDGKAVACAGADGTARIFDATTGKAVAPPMVHGRPTYDPVFSVRFSPDGTRVVTTTRARFARVWSASSGEPLTDKLLHGDEVNFAEFSPDGLRVLTASEDGTALIWDAGTGQPLVRPMRHSGEVWMARFSPDGTRVVTVSRDRTARVWDAIFGQPITEPLPHDDFVEYVDFSPDGHRILTSSYDRTARLWDAHTGLPTASPLRHAERVSSARFSPDGETIITASMDGTARLWLTQTGDLIGRPISHTRRIWYAEFSPDGQRILTASGDGTARVWQTKEPPNSVITLQHNSAVLDIEFGLGGRLLATSCYDGKVRIWKTDGAKAIELLHPPIEHPKAVVDIEFSPDGRRLVSVSRDRHVRIWNVPTGKLQFPPWHAGLGSVFAQFDARSSRVFFGGAYQSFLWDLEAHQQIGAPYPSPEGASAGRLSPDGKLAAVAGSDNVVRLYETGTNRRIGEPLSHGADIRYLEFSSDGRYLVTACMDRRARIWNLHSGRLHVPELRHNVEVLEARFDSRAERVVTASADATARIWDVRTGRPITDPLRHAGKLVSASFSPDGTRVLTASVDGTVRLWDARSGDPATAPLMHRGSLSAARFSPDGKQIATASRDGTARIWSAPSAYGSRPGGDEDSNSGVPSWFADFAEAMAGMRVNEIGAFEFIPAESNALEKIKNHLNSLPSDEPYALWARRFF